MFYEPRVTNMSLEMADIFLITSAHKMFYLINIKPKDEAVNIAHSCHIIFQRLS